MSESIRKAARAVVDAGKMTKVPCNQMPDLAYQLQILEICLNHHEKMTQVCGEDPEIAQLKKENQELRDALQRQAVP